MIPIIFVNAKEHLPVSEEGGRPLSASLDALTAYTHRAFTL